MESSELTPFWPKTHQQGVKVHCVSSFERTAATIRAVPNPMPLVANTISTGRTGMGFVED